MVRFNFIKIRGDGKLGGTFSFEDMKNFAIFKNTTERAKAKEGTYSISKTSNFDTKGFLAFARKAYSNFNSNKKAKNIKLASDYYAKKITYDDYKKQVAKEFNTELVNLHNTYKSGEKQYGYTYTLER